MHIPEQAEIIRVFIGEADKRHGRPLYELIVEEARRRGMAGATVIRGIMGFGANSRIHTAKILRLSEDLPVIVEIVDRKEKVEEFLPWLDEVVDDGMILVEEANVRMYRNAAARSSRDHGADRR